MSQFWKPDEETKNAIKKGNIVDFGSKHKPIIEKPKKKKRRRGKSNDFYSSKEWLTVRYAALLQRGRKCQCCGATPPSVRLHVDHIKPRSKYPKLELDINNLQVLCESCNLGKSNTDETDFR